MSTAVMWSNSKPDVEFQYGGRLGEFRRMSSQCHLLHCRVSPPGEFNVMIPELCVTLQGAATWWIYCRDSRATCHIAGCSHLAKSMPRSCHIAGCNNSIRHIENRFSPYFFCFLMQFGVWRAAGFVSSPINLLISREKRGNPLQWLLRIISAQKISPFGIVCFSSLKRDSGIFPGTYSPWTFPLLFTWRETFPLFHHAQPPSADLQYKAIYR